MRKDNLLCLNEMNDDSESEETEADDGEDTIINMGAEVDDEVDNETDVDANAVVECERVLTVKLKNTNNDSKVNEENNNKRKTELYMHRKK